LQSDWEASSDEEKEKPSPAAAAAAAAPHKKKGSLKQKLAEKEAERQARLALGDDQADYDEDAVLDPRAKANFEKQRELESDLRNATELFGPTDVVKGACTIRTGYPLFFFFFSLVSLKVLTRRVLTLRLVRRGSRQHLEIGSQVQGGFHRALRRHHRARHQTASRQAAVRLFCRAPRARPCCPAARCRCTQGGERTHYPCE
jgi:hypothetical protein